MVKKEKANRKERVEKDKVKREDLSKASGGLLRPGGTGGSATKI